LEPRTTSRFKEVVVGTVGSIDAYIAGFPEDTRRKLEQMRGLIKEAAPRAVETMSYAIPTFDLGGHHLVHFAGYKRHVGFYPGSQTVAEMFQEELRPYKRGKGSVQFPLERPLPLELIRRMVEFRVEQNTSKASRK
jgi:uncharacterized protein YdhG (YjbR/CyaY superfamily)